MYVLAGMMLWTLVGHAQQAGIKTYINRPDAVSFQYPAVWQRIHEPNQYFSSTVFRRAGVAEGAVTAKFAVQFTPAGTRYANTTLQALTFLYGTVPDATAASCREVVSRNTDSGKPDVRTLYGFRFNYSRGGDAGMSHVLKSEVYSTLRGTLCYVFEEDFNAYNGPVRDGMRVLSPLESKALQSDLDDIMHSVRFDLEAGRDQR